MNKEYEQEIHRRKKEIDLSIVSLEILYINVYYNANMHFGCDFITLF